MFFIDSQLFGRHEGESAAVVDSKDELVAGLPGVTGGCVPTSRPSSDCTGLSTSAKQGSFSDMILVPYSLP